MNLDNATQRARSVKGPKGAARLYNDINYELAMGEPTSAQEAEGEQALELLGEAYPGVHEASMEIETPPHTSRTATGNIHGGRRRPQPSQRGQHKRPPAPAPKTRPRPPAPRSRGRSTSSRRFAQTGIPGAYETGTQLLMRTLGGIAGLSFLYLVLSPRGSRALQLGSSGLTHGLRALTNPSVDPLRATAAAQAASRSQLQRSGAGARSSIGQAAAGIAAGANAVSQAGSAAAAGAAAATLKQKSRR